MSKYFNEISMSEISQAVENVIDIRNKIYMKYDIDIIENDRISLTKFYGIIKSVDPTYKCNYGRQNEDGKIIIENIETNVESKTTKLLKGKASFAFHAKGLINHDAYLFNVWCKKTLTPLRCYYVKNPKNINVINKELDRLSKEWKKKPSTRAGYDVIRIKEEMLEKLVESSAIVNKCKVFFL